MKSKNENETRQKKLFDKTDPLDNSRVTISLGLIAIYIAFLSIIKIPQIDSGSIFNTIKHAIVIVWGFSTIELIIFVFMYTLGLKYWDPNLIDLFGYKININQKLKRVMFDSGVENYLAGIVSYLLYSIPPFLISKGIHPVFAIPIFIFITLAIILFVAIISKKQNLSNLR